MRVIGRTADQAALDFEARNAFRIEPGNERSTSPATSGPMPSPGKRKSLKEAMNLSAL